MAAPDTVDPVRIFPLFFLCHASSLPIRSSAASSIDNASVQSSTVSLPRTNVTTPFVVPLQEVNTPGVVRASPAICQNISLYEPEQSLSLSQDEGEQC